MKLEFGNLEVEYIETWQESMSCYESRLIIDKGNDRIVLDSDEINKLKDFLDEIK